MGSVKGGNSYRMCGFDILLNPRHYGGDNLSILTIEPVWCNLSNWSDKKFTIIDFPTSLNNVKAKWSGYRYCDKGTYVSNTMVSSHRTTSFSNMDATALEGFGIECSDLD